MITCQLVCGWASPVQEAPAGVERDSVTKLHQDMSDAVNILNHVQQHPG